MVLAAAVGIGAAISTVGCGSSWWANFTNDPARQVQTFEQGVQLVLNDTQIAWTVIQPLLPADKAAAITQQYENGVFAVNHALTVLNDAVTAAVAAQQPNPDFTALMTAVTDAVGQVLAIIHQYMQPVTPPAPPVADAGPPATQLKGPMQIPAYDDAMAGLTQLKKQAARGKP